MNNFSFKRVILLIKKYIIEQWRKDLLLFLIAFLLMTIDGILFEGEGLASLVVIGGMFYISGIFSFNNARSKDIDYLMLPASSLEKTVTNIGIVHLYINAILLAAIILGSYFGLMMRDLLFANGQGIALSHIANIITLDTILTVLFFQALFIFGSIYFKKSSGIKTAAIFIAICIFITILDISVIAKFANISSINTMQFETLGMSYKSGGASVISNCAFIIFFWLLTFFRLRETEA